MKNRPRSGNSERRQAKFKHKYLITESEENQVDKYLERMLSVARSIGVVTNGEICEANKFLPKMMMLNGKTKEGDSFTLELRVGEKLNEDS